MARSGGSVDTGAASSGLNDRTRRLLADLGQSSPEVAERLRSLGVTGVRGFTRGCAVARFLDAVVGGEQAVRTIRVYRRMVLLATHTGFRWTIVSMPAAVRQFVAHFDAGLYPALEDPGTSVTARSQSSRPSLPVADPSNSAGG